MGWKLSLNPKKQLASDEAKSWIVSVMPELQWTIVEPAPMRRHIHRGTFVGTVVHDGLQLHIRITIGNVERIELEISGDGEPLALLQALSRKGEWLIFDPVIGSELKPLSELCDRRWRDISRSVAVWLGHEMKQVNPNIHDVRNALEMMIDGRAGQEMSLAPATRTLGNDAPSLSIEILDMSTPEASWCVGVHDNDGKGIMCTDLETTTSVSKCVSCGIPTLIASSCVLATEDVVDAAAFFLSRRCRSMDYQWIAPAEAFPGDDESND